MNEGARVILPVLFECEAKQSKNVTNLKEYWLEECKKRFPFNECNKGGGYGAAAIMYASTRPILLVLSYDYTSSEVDFLQPKLIAYVSEKKGYSFYISMGSFRVSVYGTAVC